MKNVWKPLRKCWRQAEYADILSKMEKMKGAGKIKTVTYQQLMSRKLTYQNMLSLYEIYGLTEKEKNENGSN